MLNSSNAIKDPRRGRISSFTRYQQRVGGSHGLHLPSIRDGLSDKFENDTLESAYQRYSRRQRQKSLIVINAIDVVLKITTIILISVDDGSDSPARHQSSSSLPLQCTASGHGNNISAATSHHDELGAIPAAAYPLASVIATSCLIIVNIFICNVAWFWRRFANNLQWAAIATEILMNVQVLIGLGYDGIFNSQNSNNARAQLTMTHMVWYILFIIFSTYAFLPLPLLWALSAACMTALTHVLVFIVVRYSSTTFNSPWEVIV